VKTLPIHKQTTKYKLLATRQISSNQNIRFYILSHQQHQIYFIFWTINMVKVKPLVLSNATVHKEIQALVAFVAMNKMYTTASKKSNKMEEELFELFHTTSQRGPNDRILSFVEQFVQGEYVFQAAFEEDVNIDDRIEAERKGKSLKFTLKKALTAFSEEKTYFVASSVSDSPLNGKTLRQCYIGGKGEALLQGRTIKSLAADAYNNYKKAQSLIIQHKLINQDGTLRSGTNDVDEVFQKLLPLLINHVCENSAGNEEELNENDLLEQESMEESAETENESGDATSGDATSGDVTMAPKDVKGMFVRGWMSIVLFSRHIGYMWELVQELELPMVMNEDYEGREKHKNGRAASRNKETEEKKAGSNKSGSTTTTASSASAVGLRDRWMYAQMMSMEYEQSQTEWESGVTLLGMEGHALKEEITTLQFMIAHSDVHSKQQYLVQLKALLGEQRRLRESVASLSTKRPKYEKMDGISGTVIDISKGSADGNGSIISVLTPGRQH
jgi:hypothetical protein